MKILFSDEVLKSKSCNTHIKKYNASTGQNSKQTGMQKEKEIHLNLTRADQNRAAQQEGASGHAMLCIQCLVPAEIKEVQNNPIQRSSTKHWLQKIELKHPKTTQ